ncbi:MAG TPA: hypothetical protein VKV05_07295 [Terriglobales bacterium]|nr:hypothetical protein [Terriglobales bacterium]
MPASVIPDKVLDLVYKALVWGVGVAFAAGGVFGLYDWADSQGYVSHSLETPIQAQGNWMVGETKDCNSFPLDSSGAKLWDKPVGYAAAEIACDGGPYRSMKVKLYGRVEQPEHRYVTWRCTREADSFTCWQRGAE